MERHINKYWISLYWLFVFLIILSVAIDLQLLLGFSIFGFILSWAIVVIEGY